MSLNSWKYKELVRMGEKKLQQYKKELIKQLDAKKEEVATEIKWELIKLNKDVEIEDISGKYTFRIDYKVKINGENIYEYAKRLYENRMAIYEDKYNKLLNRLYNAFEAWKIQLLETGITPFEIDFDLTL